MKKLTITLLLLAGLTITGMAQTNTEKSNNKPIATYMVGTSKVTVWENDGPNGKWKNYEVEKIYKKD